MVSNKELLQKRLKGTETGDRRAARVVNDDDKYIQHNPRTGAGRPGLAGLLDMGGD